MTISYKIPKENPDYSTHSAYVIKQISAIIKDAIDSKRNLIFIYTNLRHGLPLENIHKVAGPFVEAWALEQFEDTKQSAKNPYELINVEAGKRLDAFDIVLQFRRKRSNEQYVSADVDVKATAEDIKTSGKSPNITSFARIRSAFLEDPDYIFIILSLKHKVYGERDPKTGMTNGIMEVISCAAYDLKYVSDSDLNYNPALGTGQLQIKDIHYVDLQKRTVWEFIQMIDRKFIKSNGKREWLFLAKKFGWIKVE